jgi:hypothetical protein
VRIAALVVLVAIPPMQLVAQTKRACDAPEFRQFDFWVGEWEVSWPASDATENKSGRGRNRIHKALDDCAIVENFDGQPGIPLRGMSLSTYNRQLQKWQQTWVDSEGSYLDFVGEFRDGKMILQREAKSRAGKAFLQRMVWQNIKPESLDWSWERSDNGGKNWQVMWAIHYVRQK